MNNYKGRIVTTLYRKLDSSPAETTRINSFEEELLELMDVGYTVIGYCHTETLISALLFKNKEGQTK